MSSSVRSKRPRHGDDFENGKAHVDVSSSAAMDEVLRKQSTDSQGAGYGNQALEGSAVARVEEGFLHLQSLPVI